MNNFMKAFFKTQIWFVVLLSIVSLLLYAIHWYINFHFYSDLELIIPIFSIYIFNYIGVLLVFTIINFSVYKGHKNYLFIFLGATLFKMILGIVFLLPVLLEPNENAKLEVIYFFIPYFIYLAFEMLSILAFFKSK